MMNIVLIKTFFSIVSWLMEREDRENIFLAEKWDFMNTTKSGLWNVWKQRFKAISLNAENKIFVFALIQAHLLTPVMEVYNKNLKNYFNKNLSILFIICLFIIYLAIYYLSNIFI